MMLPTDPTVGDCLKRAYANSPSIPAEISQQFENKFQLPAVLVTPRGVQQNSIPSEFIIPVPQPTSTPPHQQPASTSSPRSTPPAENSVNGIGNQYTMKTNVPSAIEFAIETPKARITNEIPVEATENTKFTIPKSLPEDSKRSPGPFTTPSPGFTSPSPKNDEFIFPESKLHQSIDHHHHHTPPHTHTPSNTLATQQEHEQQSAQDLSLVTTPNTNDQKYSDITEFLNMPQSTAAKKLGIPPSTLSKRWREAAPNRKWPYRTVCKIDKEITTLLHNIPPDGVIPKDIENKLSGLIAKRQEELKTIVIRL